MPECNHIIGLMPVKKDRNKVVRASERMNTASHVYGYQTYQDCLRLKFDFCPLCGAANVVKPKPSGLTTGDYVKITKGCAVEAMIPISVKNGQFGLVPKTVLANGDYAYLQGIYRVTDVRTIEIDKFNEMERVDLNLVDRTLSSVRSDKGVVTLYNIGDSLVFERLPRDYFENVNSVIIVD